MAAVQLEGYTPGAIGRIVEMHATYYYEHWGFGLFFESKIAVELSEFLNRFDASRDGFWIAKADNNIVGSVAIDGIEAGNEGAHLRWFIIDPAYQGHGIGNRLLEESIEFCRRTRFRRVYLWTFAGLEAAGHLYEKWGFSVCRELEAEQWGITMHEQMFELLL